MLIEVATKNMSVLKWSLGDLELKVQKEDGKVTSTQIREVGDFMTALKNSAVSYSPFIPLSTRILYLETFEYICNLKPAWMMLSSMVNDTLTKSK